MARKQTGGVYPVQPPRAIGSPWILAGALGLAIILGASPPAMANKTVYSPIIDEGEKEVEFYMDYRRAPDGVDEVNYETAFEYGFAPHDRIALYLVHQDRAPDGLRVIRYKTEWVHQFFEQGERAIDVGTYLEYQLNDGASAADKVEFKLLLAKDVSRLTFTANAILEQQLGAAAEGGTEWGYALRAAWRIHRRLTPALEAFGDLGKVTNLSPVHRQSHLVGPALDLRFTRQIVWHLGALWGLTQGTENLRLKSTLTWEWY